MLINNINFKYGSNEIYNNFNIEFQQGKINCIIGESGCGKTTLLNYISEKLYYENKRIAYVFQEDNLIPWKNIYVNLKIVAKKYFEKSILEKHKLKSFVKIKQDQIQIVISNKKHDEKLANNIIRTVQSNFDTQMYITVKFQS